MQNEAKQWFIIWKDDDSDRIHKKGVNSWEAGNWLMHNVMPYKQALWTGLVSQKVRGNAVKQMRQIAAAAEMGL